MLNFNYATWSLFPEHNFRQWVKLTSIVLILSFRLEQQACFRVCVVPMVPITFHLIIPLTWCHRRSITSSWNLSTIVSCSSTFWALPAYQSNSDKNYHPWPSMIWVVIDNPLSSFQHIFDHVLIIPWTPCYSCNCSLSISCDLQLKLFLEYLLWSSTQTTTWNTMLMLPQSMTEVFRISTRTLEAHCRMFLDLLSKHRCMGNIMILIAPLTKWISTWCPVMYILLCLFLGSIYSNTFV